MTRTPAVALALALVIVPISSTPSAASDDRDVLHPRIRTVDRRLRQLLDEGTQRSPRLRALVERLTHSDVVVYVMCDGDPRSRIAGRMTFVSAAGGFRYLAVRLVPLQSRAHQIAILAHELQHAVEVADAPSIVDGESLAREYLRIGHVNRRAPPPGIAFDTQAAIDAGQQVLDELSSTMMGD